MSLSASQIATLEIIERTNASISVFSTLLLLTTSYCLPSFRSLSNTLIFYASFANLFANIAALMGRSAVSNPGGAWCQFQGFLLQMFMQSDPLWSCAMAINVYLCFFRRFSAEQLKRLNWIYGILCYGIPAIPAIFCLFYREKRRGRVYGDATPWCWIGNPYSDVRIYSYYLPIWIAILISLIIYLRVGIVLYKVRKELRAFEYSMEPSTNSNTHHRRTSSLPIIISTSRFSTTSKTPILASPPSKSNKGAQTEHLEDIHPSQDHTFPFSSAIQPPLHLNHDEESPPPPPSNLNYTYTPPHPSLFPRPPRHPTNANPNANPNKLNITYTKSALLFTASILITWVPASVNRVHGLIYPHQPLFSLQVASAFVLPLQGFWNAVIFFSSSWGVVTKTRFG